jgi:hypothetical protein
MLKIKIFAIITVFFCSILYYPVVSAAIMRAGGGGTNSDRGEGAPYSNSNGMTRVTSFVKTIDSNTIVLEDNRSFSLSGVQVINKKADKSTAGKTVVEMLFINNALKQVVIH